MLWWRSINLINFSAACFFCKSKIWIFDSLKSRSWSGKRNSIEHSIWSHVYEAIMTLVLTSLNAHKFFWYFWNLKNFNCRHAFLFYFSISKRQLWRHLDWFTPWLWLQRQYCKSMKFIHKTFFFAFLIENSYHVIPSKPFCLRSLNFLSPLCVIATSNSHSLDHIDSWQSKEFSFQHRRINKRFVIVSAMN